MARLHFLECFVCLILLRFKNVSGNYILCPSLGCTYNSLGCSLSSDSREMFCSNKNIKGPLFIVDLPNVLEELYLNDNYITVLEPKMFIGTNRLRVLYLNNNNIIVLKDNTFINSKDLAILNLENNNIADISNAAFVGLLSLASLEIAGNPVSQPTKKCPVGKFLKKVTLSFDQGAKAYIYECKPTILCDGCNHDDRFSSTEKDLCTFDQLTITFDCTNAGFAGKLYLKSITERSKIIKLGKNEISSIDDRTFRDLEDVEVIDLSNNKIVELDKSAFLKMQKLEKLDLTNNPITEGNLQCAGEHIVPRNETLVLPGNGNSITWESCASKLNFDDVHTQLSNGSTLWNDKGWKKQFCMFFAAMIIYYSCLINLSAV